MLIARSKWTFARIVSRERRILSIVSPQIRGTAFMATGDIVHYPSIVTGLLSYLYRYIFRKAGNVSTYLLPAAFLSVSRSLSARVLLAVRRTRISDALNALP